MAYVLALPEAMCEILMKFMIHILKALDISYWKMQEKFEIITNHKLQFWTKLLKNGQCAGQHKKSSGKFEDSKFKNSNPI